MKDGKVLIALVAGFAAGTLLGAIFVGKGSSKSKNKNEKSEKLKEEVVMN
jgi:hypothetical protein